MSMTMEKKLQVRNLRISFRTNGGKVQAVRDISFDLHKGETLAIVGESGSGKSVTSKAILGIQAGNAITEGGEILYDGQDLLKISEDDFYRLRGDKVAMIFQDPLSSLNPIMRIGKQLTEAMLLKGKARQRSCRDNFNNHLKTLENYMVEADPAKDEEAKAICKKFDTFEIEHTKLEQDYNVAKEFAEDALVEIEHLLFLIEKSAYTDKDKAGFALVQIYARQAINPWVLPEGMKGEIHQLTDFFTNSAPAFTFAQRNVVRLLRLSDPSALMKLKDMAVATENLRKLQAILSDTLKTLEDAEPDFFAMGYFKAFGSGDMPKGAIAQQNAFYADYVEKNFMTEFETKINAAFAHADAKYLTKRAAVITKLESAIADLKNGTIDAFKPQVADLCKQVDDSIDPLDIVKDSAACTFSGAMKDFVARYDLGKRTNARKIAKYERQSKKAEKAAARGKEYKVAAASVIDLDLVKTNMLALMEHLAEHYTERNAKEASENKQLKTEKLIAYFKENASGMVNKVTKQAAKNKPLKLMAEVGIPEPRKRYNQYPFEFSGGMRQRIVIAIALAANPDILICDEPTTALDVTIQAQILELINKLKEKRNLSIIFITHDLGVVANMADRIAVMYAGKIVEYGTAEEVFYSPAHPYTWALLSSMPDLDSKDKLEAIPGTPPNMIYPPKGDAFADRNRYAMKIDFEMQPPAFPITDTHWAATWLLHPNAPKIDPPKTITERVAKMKARMEEEVHG